MGTAVDGAVAARRQRFLLAATLLGSGGTGISAGQAAQLIAQGVREANDQVSSDRNERRSWPRVSDLRVIELYLDRATEAWRSLRRWRQGRRRSTA